VIASLLAHGEATDEWMIDAGVRDDCVQSQTQWMRETTARNPGARWIIASESARSVGLVKRVAEQVDVSSLVLGIDFRSGQFVGPETGCEGWLQAADGVGVSCGLVLDVAAVGSAAGPQTMDHCGWMSACFPEWRWISGGGCRNLADVGAVLRSGCEGCLIASALLPS
jgi:phosphoribosylformimino-5-aminoimidazole carboxamide ribotide isomerase